MKILGLANVFTQLAAQTPERLFAQTDEGPLLFQELSAAADAVALRLEACGVKRGDRVVVMMTNSTALLATIYGLMRAGFVWVPANPQLVGNHLAHIIDTTMPRLILCDVEFEPVLRELPSTQRIDIEVVRDKSLPTSNGASYTCAVPQPSDLAAIMFTSGTTGPAKGVMVSHLMLELAAKSVVECADLVSGDNLFVWEPFYHIGGAQVVLLPIVQDVVLTITNKFSASQFWPQVAAARCTHIHHLGGVVQILLKQPSTSDDRSHNVRIAWGGGCAPAVWRQFEDRFGVQIRECYGMTECSSLTTCNDLGVVGSVGRPMPWFELELIDEAGRKLGPGEGKGEIIVRSSLPGAITEGYFSNPEATAKALQADGFHTGDLGSWDENGMLFFHGRATDSVRSRGENVSAHEVESIANLHCDVEEAAMVGVPSDIGEQDIQLFVKLRKGARLEPADLWNWMAKQLAPYQRPRFISFIATLPRTPSQRVQKHLIEADPHARWEAASSKLR